MTGDRTHTRATAAFLEAYEPVWAFGADLRAHRERVDAVDQLLASIAERFAAVGVVPHVGEATRRG